MIKLIKIFAEKMCHNLDKFYSEQENKNMLIDVELNTKSKLD